MTILERYNQAQFHTRTSREQREVFSWWRTSPQKPMLATDTETTSLTFGLPTVLWTGNDFLGSEDSYFTSVMDSVSIDTGKESTLLQHVQDVVDCMCFGISLAVERDGVVHCFWGRLGSPLFKSIVKLLEVEGPKCFHNARYDLRVMQVNKIQIASEVECTYTMSRILWDRRRQHGLKSLSEFLCPELSCWDDIVKQELTIIRRQLKKLGLDMDLCNYSFINDVLMSKYAMQDTFMGLMLWERLNEEAKW